MKKTSIIPISLAVIITGAVVLWLAIEAPARAVQRTLAAINSLSVGETTEAELLTRKEFQTIDRMCHGATCFYHVAIENTLLSNLRLAPRTTLWTWVQVRDGLVTGVSVIVTRAGIQAISVNQQKVLPKECSAVPCVKHFVLPNKAMSSVDILFDNQSDLRNHIPQAVDARCWSRLHGCSTYAELIPLTQGMNLGQTEPVQRLWENKIR